jgi:MFS family permease
VLAVCLPAIQPEFNLSDSFAAIATTCSTSGMFVGALLWGFSSDRYGRKIPFIGTLLVSGLFGILAAFALDIQLFCILFFLTGIGVDGSTDGALFLEFVPMRQSMYLSLIANYY